MVAAISSKGGRSEGSGRSKPTVAAVSVRVAMPWSFVPSLLSIQSLGQKWRLSGLPLTILSIVILVARLESHRHVSAKWADRAQLAVTSDCRQLSKVDPLSA